jgi:hypothetical protein
MAITPDIWFGTNDVIYSQNRTIQTSLSAGASMKLDFGLSDMAELPGQSTVFVNKLKFQVTVIPEFTLSFQDGTFCAGIVPRDAVGAGYETVKDFQDYMAWPLKGCVGFNITPGISVIPGGRVSTFSMTYSPRKALLINREQNIIFTYKSEGGGDVTVMLNCMGQFKRGN